MEKNLYIDASHPDETRVVLKSQNHIEEYEYENKNKLYLKNNIYLGKVSRIEPSLQAAFINYGKQRHGFLAFNDIQSDYYQIPHDDKDKLKKEEENLRLQLKEKSKNVEENEKTTINNSGEVNQEDIVPERMQMDENMNFSVPQEPFRGARGGIVDVLESLRPRMAGGGTIMDYTRGGHAVGPGTGTSDSIDAKLSDGEFVMTAKAVENLGGGDRYEGARKMYDMMNVLDPESETMQEVV